MLGTMLHEDFYVSKVWIDEGLGAYIGVVARSHSYCHEGIVLEDGGKTALAFSGEEYSANSSMRGLGRIAREDESFPSCLNGRFHGVLINARKGSATLFNDRYGMHRVYFHQASDTFYFAAEAKAILAVCPETRELNFRSLGEFVSCGAALEDRTVFRGIEVLPPGSRWSLRNGSVCNSERYFNPSEWEEQEPLPLEPYYRQLSAVFQSSLSNYFTGNEAIAMSLTGGLDTRMVIAGRKPAPNSLTCYTFGSMFRENEDVRRARQISEICRQSFQVITAGNEFLQRFPDYAQRSVYLSDGCVDVSRAPDLYLNSLARSIAPVRMTGLFGGEVLRGVRAFKPTRSEPGLFSKEFEHQIHLASETYTQALKCRPLTFSLFAQNPWYLHGSLSLEETQLTVRSPFLDNEFVRTVYRSPAAELASSRVSWQLVKDGNSVLQNLATDRGLIVHPTSLRGKLLHGRLEFLFKAEYAFDMGMPQWLARVNHLFSGVHLEHLFLGRHKPFHFRVWYRDFLGDYIKQVLLDDRTLSRPYLNRYAVEQVVTGHLKGNRNFTHEVHKLLTLELLQRALMESKWISGCGIKKPVEQPETSYSFGLSCSAEK